MIVLMLGSGPGVVACRQWPRAPFDRIVAINNAWQVRPDWDHLVHPEDFPPERHPPALQEGQSVIGAGDYVPANNAFGGIVYAGATMAFTAGYWALHALRPRVLAYLGCDMVYAAGRTHFYGTGSADPLRPDPTLQDLAAKAARLELLAAQAGCAVVNLSLAESRLCFRPVSVAGLPGIDPAPVDRDAVALALQAEAEAAQVRTDGRYWQGPPLDAAALARIDALWRRAFRLSRVTATGNRAAG